MSTPTPGKQNPLSQGRTPSSQPPHGAAATPSASTPFSVNQAVFSPLNQRSSPQQTKKSSPATLGRSMMGSVNFDSPSTAAALMDINAALDLGLQTFNNLSVSKEDEMARKLDNVIAILSRCKGLVSEAGLERLAKKLELEYMWESSMGSDSKRTLIVAGSALELLIEFCNDVVQSVALSFPDSAEIVNKHAEAAGEILSNDLRLRNGQSPLTKSLDGFVANFERLAVLDKLSIMPALNLFEAIAGIYESLCRLHAWELQKAREEASAETRAREQYLENLVTCTKSGKPTMNARGRVGMALEYWKEDWQITFKKPSLREWADEVGKRRWSILVDCAPHKVNHLNPVLNPVRISDKWIGPNLTKIPHPGELHAATGLTPMIDWLEPESTFVPISDQTKADPMQPDPSLLGPRLPDVVFHAAFDPPVHIPEFLWLQIRQLGCVMDESPLRHPMTVDTFDSLVLPYPPGQGPDGGDSRQISITKRARIKDDATPGKYLLKRHATSLYVYLPEPSRTLTGMTFSHPQQLISILPSLRQYVFLATLLENSFKEQPDAQDWTDPADKKLSPAPVRTSTVLTNQTAYSNMTTAHTTTTTTAIKNEIPPAPWAPEQTTQAAKEGDDDDEPPLRIDTTLTMDPVPHLKVSFPFGEKHNNEISASADVELEIRENGAVHVLSQNVLTEANGNMVMRGGSSTPRKAEDVGALLERLNEDVGRWVEFMRRFWAPAATGTGTGADSAVGRG
ncbi:hypothetical protein N658DRAFT_442064 [Parathielavia hyrcaniae]|uniref:Mediator of RNA polymerase II transcription subunit 1 n=1 Tax=Parathielavia hyrcaniae TaxID=113614 RepID=A0AAN6QA61_9PEZI|nr:hypothetical protein N658DRAFT_442064 [Parathielavia hyrcaniae]